MPRQLAAVLFVVLNGVAFSMPAAAHCDTTKGPVITAARAALEAGDPNLVLHWVRPQDEPAIRSAFDTTRNIRALGPEAKTFADRYFFETLVRIHRTGEGAPYLDLKDEEPEPIIAATDRAIELGSADEVEQQLVQAVRTGLAERFARARAARDFRPGNVEAGRAFVATYVPLTHWVEGVFTAAGGAAEHHATVAGHDAAHALVQQPANHSETGATTEGHGHAALRSLPWILTSLLAIIALVEGGLLVRRGQAPA